MSYLLIALLLFCTQTFQSSEQPNTGLTPLARLERLAQLEALYAALGVTLNPSKFLFNTEPVISFTESFEGAAKYIPPCCSHNEPLHPFLQNILPIEYKEQIVQPQTRPAATHRYNLRPRKKLKKTHKNRD